MGVNKKVVNRSQNCPEKGVKRADNALKITPIIGLVPKFDVHSFNKDNTCNILNQRHTRGHNHKQNKFGGRLVLHHDIRL